MKTQKTESGKLDWTKFKVSKLNNLTAISGGTRDDGPIGPRSKRPDCLVNGTTGTNTAG